MLLSQILKSFEIVPRVVDVLEIRRVRQKAFQHLLAQDLDRI